VSAIKTRAVKSSAVKKRAAKKSIAKKTVVKKPPAKKSAAKKALTKMPPVKKFAVKSGDLAPAFSALNQEGKKISLTNFKGKQTVVLYFYPRAMTPGCTVQACGVRDTAAEFKRMNAVVLGVSPDKATSLVKFRERDKLNFDLLSDEDNRLSKAYGTWGMKKFMGREFMGVRRWTFIIGKDGKIKHVIDDVNTKTHHNDVLALLKSL